MLENHEFIEAKFVHGTVYGTGAKEIQAIAEAGKIAVTDINVQGVSEYKKLSGDVAGEMVDALSVMRHRSEAPGLGREIVKKLKEVVPRQSFEVALQAANRRQVYRPRKHWRLPQRRYWLSVRR